MTRVQDAASSSSALAIPSGVSVAAKRASEEQTERPAVGRFSFGTVNDKDPCDDPSLTGYSNEKRTLSPEGIEAVFSRNGVMVGEIFCPDQVGLRKLKQEEAKVDLVTRLPVPVEQIEDRKNRHHDKTIAEEISGLTVELREVLSKFGKKPEGKKMDAELKKEVLKLPAAKIEKINTILVNASYTKTLRTMHFQRANMTLISSFCSIDWRKDHRFPRFSNDSAAYKWWEQNFDPVILERRLEIFREAEKNRKPTLDMFMIIELVSDLNSELHPQPSENELHEEDLGKMFRLLTRICSLRSGGDSKI